MIQMLSNLFWEEVDLARECGAGRACHLSSSFYLKHGLGEDDGDDDDGGGDGGDDYGDRENVGMGDRAILPFCFPYNSFSFKPFKLGDLRFFFTYLELHQYGLVTVSDDWKE